VGEAVVGGFVVGAVVAGSGLGDSVVAVGADGLPELGAAEELDSAALAAAFAIGLLSPFFGGPAIVPMMNISTRNPTTPDTDHTVTFFRRDQLPGRPRPDPSFSVMMVPPKNQ